MILQTKDFIKKIFYKNKNRTGGGIKFYSINNKLKNLYYYKDSVRLIVILFSLLFLSFVFLAVFDRYDFKDFSRLFKNPNSEDVVSNLLANAGGEIVLGLLGIVMTVVAIVVELAANRYTPRVSDLFVRDKVNILFLILLSFVSSNLVIILFISRSGRIPSGLINISVAGIMIAILTLVPYFIYVFRFLEPNNIISKIEYDILKNTIKAKFINEKNYQKLRSKIDALQLHIVRDIDQLTDIVLNSIDKKDKVLATNCIKSLSNFTIDYILLKNEGKLAATWFFPSSFVRYNNADFVTLMDDSFEMILKDKTWLEHKLFMQLVNIFQESLNKERDICNFVAQSFYSIGKHAVNVRERNVMLLVVKIFNTLMRSTLNAMDLRTCFNLLNQYKFFTITLIEAGEQKLVLDIVNYFKYYGLLAKNAKKMPFLLETVAHDLCDICKKAYINKLDEQKEILNIILTVDEPLEGEKEEASLRGIRKAQVILAIFYLSLKKDDADIRARMIFNDFLDEVDRKTSGFQKIYAIIRELKYLKAEFWEIIDRGLNIDYIPEKTKKYLDIFLSWFINREIIRYAFLQSSSEKKKANELLKKIYDALDELPKEIPIENKDFLSIFGEENMDTKKSFYNNVILLCGRLKNKNLLKNELHFIKDFNEKTAGVKFINSIAAGIAVFEKEFRKRKAT